jgi:hypothetical protein
MDYQAIPEIVPSKSPKTPRCFRHLSCLPVYSAELLLARAIEKGTACCRSAPSPTIKEGAVTRQASWKRLPHFGILRNTEAKALFCNRILI